MSESSHPQQTEPQIARNTSEGHVVQPARNPSESHPIQITTIQLNGDNFLRWSQSVRMYIRGRGKIGYLTGESKRPDVEDPAYAIWDAENSMVMTWLVNSMVEKIGANYMCYSTAKELWDNVSQMYSDLGNQSQVYELTLRLGEIHQGMDSVTMYFNSLKMIWQDLDLFNNYAWKSTEDCNHYKKMVDVSRLFKFLAGLNIEFDEVRGRIIGKNPLPPIGEVFAEVRREETRRNVMLGKKASNTIGAIEGSALAIPEAQVSRKMPQNQRGGDRNNLRSDYCGKPRHTRENCFKLHGRPPNNGKENRYGEQSIPVANEAESSPFSKEQLDHLLKLLKSYSSPTVPVGSVAQSVQEMTVGNMENSGIFGSPLPDVVSETGGELPPKNHPELQVYSRKKFHKQSTAPVISPANVQSDSSSNDPTPTTRTIEIATTYSINSASVQMVVMYKECLHDHAAQTMDHFLDCCGLFEASSPNGILEAMSCAACHCHRNFHRRVEETSGRKVMEMRVKMPRKRLIREQTETLKAISESNNWKWFRDYSKEEIAGVCSEIGITRMAFKSWIFNQRRKRWRH
ncbi:hypothetical protein BUALT_Bualt15G0086600 [Buddleja alternifolia]|uniref:ZF-HD dimerization-type domain-containing protein n=1 Tax=Buddleja alternifolia TaxID=168488 RepID=A0AAV6WLF5_9LAMI|nr:hypothetical protein BUALT_Bualt15G0086600 [Buddleja alternifolia]